MAKISGLGALVTVQDSSAVTQTISNDVTNFTFTTPRAVEDITGVDKSAKEALLLLADYTNTLNGVFNSAAGASHPVFKDVASTSATRVTKIAPTASSGASPYLQVNALYTDYQITRAAGGALTWQAPGVLQDGTPPSWT